MQRILKNSPRLIAVALLVGLPSLCLAHGGGGKVYTATGPAARMAGPATVYYGGFDGVPLAVSGYGYQPNASVQQAVVHGHGRAPAHRMVYRRRGR